MLEDILGPGEGSPPENGASAEEAKTKSGERIQFLGDVTGTAGLICASGCFGYGAWAFCYFPMPHHHPHLKWSPLCCVLCLLTYCPCTPVECKLHSDRYMSVLITARILGFTIGKTQCVCIQKYMNEWIPEWVKVKETFMFFLCIFMYCLNLLSKGYTMCYFYNV